ncbi:Coiled-coil domain-containing 37 [Brachionus plicatilis]|uniref:Coiled-coil domain-containing 37 n=1 Tax=Brachionus plicatilis TaxID=10195 RepID=A0A3M7SYI9_BRAPC|nr:Coiled-coil domain-containing 37 [Brachionus plicatilis]
MPSNNLALTLPAISKKNDVNAENPFKMPADTDILMLREKEKQQKIYEREMNKNLKVHQKLTHNRKMVEGMKSGLKPQISDDENDDDFDDLGKIKSFPVKEDRTWTVAVTRDRRIEKESLKDYINKKREMFFVQYSLGVKRDEMRKLEEIAAAEEKRIEMAEKYLEEDAALFDEFLKENGNNSTQAVKIAEEETRKKTEKSNEIKKINTQIMVLKSEITKMEDTLKEYKLYKKFLDKVTPQALKEAKNGKKYSSKSRLDSSKSSSTIDQKPGSAAETSQSKSSLSVVNEAVEKDNDDEASDEDEDMELYFSDPQQLLDIFLELEEQNLSLIQNSQDTEEALEEMKQTINKTKQKMERETELLKKQIEYLNEDIKREMDRENDLKIKASYFNYGEFKAEEQEKILKELNSKVEDVYINCIGSNEANISTLQMLTNIENKLEELFQKIEQMPPEKVQEAEKAKEKERRLKQREERIIEQKRNQEERIKKALERARAEPKKNMGRRLMVRSKPPATVKIDRKALDEANKIDEELAYYFT